MTLKQIILKTLTACCGLLWLMVAGQDTVPAVEVKPGADSIYLGSQTSIVFSVASPGDYLWQWPTFTEKISPKIEIVSQTGIDTTRQRRSDLVIMRKQLTVTSFDSGFHAVPPFTFQYQIPGDTIWKPLETEPFLLYVAGFDVDLAAPIRDIKGPIRAPVTFREILPWLLLVIVLIGALLYYRHYLKKKKEKIPLLPKPAKPKIPAHTRALDALEQLRQKKLWQSGRIKEYHSEITDILRQYLEERYRIMAVEMTTSEIMEIVKDRALPGQAMENLRVTFERADLVKFAKSAPLPAQHEESFMLAVEFIRATIPLAIEQEATSQNNENQTGNAEVQV